MSRLAAASERLGQALQSLELACQALVQSRRSLTAAEERVSVLTGEQEKLRARVAELEEQLQTLASLNEDAEDRVDGAIAQIRTSLGR